MACVAATFWLLHATVGHARDFERKYDFDVHEEALGAALNVIAQQTDLIVLFPNELAGTTGMKPVAGWHTVREAISLLLRGTRLSGGLTEHGVIYISISDNEQARTEEIDMTGRKVSKSLWASVAGFLYGVVAHAQESQPLPGENVAGDAPRIEEIIVTATRREQSIQTVPVSINAFSGDQLAKSGYVGVGQFLDSVPGVTSMAEGAGNNVVIIRNVATSTQEQGGPVTATYFDDFAISSPAGGVPEIRLVDMQRVEVLKGPQGTLFGRSAMGGIVRFISNKPDAAALAGGVSTYVSQTTDGGLNVGGHAYLNLPLGEKLAARFVAYSYQVDGFIDNVELGIKDYNDESTVGGRAAVRWEPTDTLTLDLTYLFQDTDAAPNWASDIHTPSGDIPFDVDERTNVGGVRMARGFESQFVSLRADQQFDPFTATLLATHTRITSSQVFDQREFVNLTTGCACDYHDDKDDPTTIDGTDILELRVVSPKDRFIDYIFGLYYEDSTQDVHQIIRYLGPPQAIYGGLLSLTDGVVSIDRRSQSKSREQAVYGEAGLNLTDRTRLAFGYRWSDVRYSYTTLQANGLFDILTGAAADLGVKYQTDEKVNTYKLTLEHRITDDVFGYVLASSGYRRGGFNEPTLTSPFSTYGSDSLWNYEIGAKSTWLDGRLLANVAAFYLDFSDMQLVVQDPVTFVRATRNAGKARIPGVELSLALQATDYLSFNFSGAWSEPELLEDVPGGVSGKKGDRLPGSATESFSASATLGYPVGRGFNLEAIASYKYVGERLNDFNTTLDVALPAYDMLDLRLGLRSDRGYSLTLFADNVFDEATIYRVDHQGATFDVAATSRPRTVGMGFTYDF